MKKQFDSYEEFLVICRHIPSIANCWQCIIMIEEFAAQHIRIYQFASQESSSFLNRTQSCCPSSTPGRSCSLSEGLWREKEEPKPGGKSLWPITFSLNSSSSSSMRLGSFCKQRLLRRWMIFEAILLHKLADPTVLGDDIDAGREAMVLWPLSLWGIGEKVLDRILFCVAVIILYVYRSILGPYSSPFRSCNSVSIFSNMAIFSRWPLIFSSTLLVICFVCFFFLIFFLGLGWNCARLIRCFTHLHERWRFRICICRYDRSKAGFYIALASNCRFAHYPCSNRLEDVVLIGSVLKHGTVLIVCHDLLRVWWDWFGFVRRWFSFSE